MTLARATFTLAAGSAVSLAAGAASAKVIALLTGPDGVGTVGLLVSLLSLAAILAGFGIGTALVRDVAIAAAAADAARIRRLHRAARFVTFMISALVAVVIAVGRAPIAEFALGDAAKAETILLVAPAVIFSGMASVESALVNGLHQVARLAAVTALSAVATAIALVAAVWFFGVDGAAVGLLAGSAAGWLVAVVAARTTRPTVAVVDPVPASRELPGLLRFGAIYTLSQLLGMGAQLLIPFIVLALLQTADVGFYRAATTISVAYLAFLLNAMAQDYYPRISSAASDAIDIVARRQLSFVLQISLPLILVTSAVAPLIVTILYSDAFQPATAVLRWQLVGDVVKLPSWVLSFVVLARGSSRSFLTLETVFGLALVAFSLVAIPLYGLAGAGIGYAAAYAVYYLAAAAATRRVLTIRFGREERQIAAVCAVLILVEVLRPTAGDLLLSLTVGVAGIVWAAISFHSLRRRPAENVTDRWSISP